MSTTAYKLVDRDGYTRRGESGETLWLPVGTIVSPTGTRTTPCGPGVLHAYASPEVAVLGNPVHAGIIDPRCLRVEIVTDAVWLDDENPIPADTTWSTDGLKRWIRAPLRVVEEVSLPALSMTERVAWAICLAPHPATRNWAIDWLSGRDRTAAAARAAWAAAKAAEAAAWAAAEATTEAAARAAAWMAEAAAARAAARAAEAAEARAAAFESRLMPILTRARAILAGEFPAEQFDQPLEEGER